MENNNLAVKRTAVGNFLDFYLKETNVFTLPESSVDKNLVKQSLVKIVEYATTNNIKLSDLSQASVVSAVELVKALGINPTLPNMAYVVVYGDKLSIEPYKFGYIEIFRNHGADVARILNIWSIRKNDVFVAPKFIGAKMTEAEYEQNTTYGKVLKIVLQYETTYGEIKYLMAERNNIIPSLIGHIKKIGGNKFKNDVDKAVAKIQELDEFDSAYKYVKDNFSHLLSPAWKDYPETMFETKMINFIVRNHPISNNAPTHVAQAIKDVVDADFIEVERVDKRVNDENLKYEVEKENAIGSVDVEEKEETTNTEETSNISKDFEVNDEDDVEDEEQQEYNDTRIIVEETGEIVGKTHDKEEPKEEEQTEEIDDPHGFMELLKGN